ncbi:MAG: hypothetical protein GTO63_03535 [Anaerolineae bacterium]|nr:hypothetical protein [Anaerolineae bacterium]NIN94080.1 hypothetical protein [Anaerolineae bacterium]NIQ77126.1 hypothetical protein [Anaerolineae bacterium]
MKRIALTGFIVVLGLAVFAGVVYAEKPTGFDQRGNETSWANSNAFDNWGYNYQGNLFSGPYCYYDRHYDPENPDWNDGYCDVDLIMKWSDMWLNEDRVRCAGTPQQGSSACDGSWLTNHQRGEYVNADGRTCKWTYFVKILYPGYTPTDVDPVDGLDDATGARIIWGAYIVIQSVDNDTCAGVHGVNELVQPAGFGAW